jgi:4'-phosphopantetheinyl transferase
MTERLAAPFALPASGRAQVYVLAEAATVPPDFALQAARWLSQEEQLRWQRLLQPADRRRFLLSRLLLRGVLSQLAGVEAAELQFERSASGKPWLAAPQREPTLEFNLSHTPGLLALAVSQASAIGVDVESEERAVAALALAERYFTAAEAAELRALGGAARRTQFFRLWTLKEAYLKACGNGLSQGLDACEFAFTADGEPRLLRAPDDPQRWSCHVRSLGKLQLAVAIARPATALDLLEVEPGDLFR